MHNYYDPPIPQHANGLAISLGDDELFGFLDDLEPDLVPPQSPERRPALGGQPRVTKKSSKSTLRSRKSAATLKSPPTPLSSVAMAQSAGAAAGPHAYAMSASFANSRPPGPNIAPAAAAAAHSQLLRTPVKQEDVNSPSTILARNTTPRANAQYITHNSSYVAPSPTPATRLRSNGKVVAPASEYSPAKGVFEKPKPKRRKSPPIPDMSSAMSQFQVTLNGSAEAHPISVPKPPEKNMQPSSVVGVGLAGASMAARAARASAQARAAQQQLQQPFYTMAPSMSANASASSMNTSAQAQAQAQLNAQLNAQMSANMSTNAGAASMNKTNITQQRRMNAPMSNNMNHVYWKAPSPQRPQQAQSRSHGHPQQPQASHHIHRHRLNQQHPSSAPTASSSSSLQAPQFQVYYRPPPAPAPAPPPPPPQPQQSLHSPILQAPPQYRLPQLSPFSSDVSTYSPPADIDTKSLTPPVFSPPVSRSSSIRSPISEEQWFIEHGVANPPPRARQMQTPPTPHTTFAEKIPEIDDFKIDWMDGVMDEQWDSLGLLK